MFVMLGYTFGQPYPPASFWVLLDRNKWYAKNLTDDSEDREHLNTFLAL